MKYTKITHTVLSVKNLYYLPPGSPELEACQVERFIDALDFGPLEDLLRFHKLEYLS